MTRPSGRLLSNYFVSGAGTSVQDLIFTVTGKPCFTGKHFSLKSLSKDSFHFHVFGGSFPGKVDLFPGKDFRVAAERLFPAEEVFSQGMYVVWWSYLVLRARIRNISVMGGQVVLSFVCLLMLDVRNHRES